MANFETVASKQRKRDRAAEIMQLRCRGWDQAQIAKHFNITQGRVSQICKVERDRCRKEFAAHEWQDIAVKLRQYAEIRREAWLAWERSKEDSEKVVEEFDLKPEVPKCPQCKQAREWPGCSNVFHAVLSPFAEVAGSAGIGEFAASEVAIRRVTTREGRLPDNRYLQTIVNALDAERKLLGMDEETRQKFVAMKDAQQVLLAILQNGLNLLGVSPYFFQIVIGIVILASTSFTAWSARQKPRRATRPIMNNMSVMDRCGSPSWSLCTTNGTSCVV